MKWLSFGVMSFFLTGLLLLRMPVAAYAQTDQLEAGQPPIGQKLVREGDFAVKLESALAVGTSQDEAEAESLLTDLGISPRNGWIADYPVTPDIIAEISKSVHDAAESNAISMKAKTAEQRLNGVIMETGLAINAASSGNSTPPEIPGATSYPSSTEIDNYYYAEGPPVVTYYAPPPDYYYMYGWVPYPFWYDGFWFSGFFILNDFHRIDADHHRRRFISNHFTDVRNHRVFRIDPVARINGTNLTGRGSATAGGVPSGVSRSGRTISNVSRMPAYPASRATSPAFTGNKMVTPSFRSEGSVNTSVRSPATVSTPYRGNSSIGTPMRSSGTFSMPSRGSASFTSHFTGGGGFGGRGHR